MEEKNSKEEKRSNEKKGDIARTRAVLSSLHQLQMYEERLQKSTPCRTKDVDKVVSNQQACPDDGSSEKNIEDKRCTSASSYKTCTDRSDDTPLQTPSQSDAEEFEQGTITLQSNEMAFRLKRKQIRLLEGVTNSNPEDDFNSESVTCTPITENYDCIVLAHHDNQWSAFLVSRSVVSLSSSYFEEDMLPVRASTIISAGFIFTDFCSFRKELKWRLLLPNCNPTALRSILQILHFTATNNLLILSLTDFTQIALLCDRYKLQKALLPWAHIWLKAHKSQALSSNNEEWLLISSVFGYLLDSPEFSCERQPPLDLVSILSFECSGISKRGKYAMRGKRQVSMELWPDKIIDKIILLRANNIKYIVSRLIRTISVFRRNDHEVCNTKNCVTTVYGSFLRSLEELDLLRVLASPDQPNWDGSVIELVKRIKDIQFDTIGVCPTRLNKLLFDKVVSKEIYKFENGLYDQLQDSLTDAAAEEKEKEIEMEEVDPNIKYLVRLYKKACLTGFRVCNWTPCKSKAG